MLHVRNYFSEFLSLSNAKQFTAGIVGTSQDDRGLPRSVKCSQSMSRSNPTATDSVQ